jgi:hypothetical protein
VDEAAQTLAFLSGETMGLKYCKAYYMRDIRQFRNWVEKRKDREPALSDDTIVYLRDDFSVVTNPIVPEEEALFEQITPEWKEFCQTSLHFEIPEDLRPFYEDHEEPFA